MKIKDLDLAKYNPRKISSDNISKLCQSIKDFSESVGKNGYRLVDPIIVNKKTMTIVGGHQRIKALRMLGQDFVDDNDIKYVNLNIEMEKALNIALNNPNLMGVYDLEKLDQLLNELANKNFDIKKTGFNEKDLEKLFKYKKKENDPEIEFSKEILLEHNYIVLYFDNPFDWQVAVEKFKLKTVIDHIPRKGQPKGIGRVLNGSEWLNKIQD